MSGRQSTSRPSKRMVRRASPQTKKAIFIANGTIFAVHGLLRIFFEDYIAGYLMQRGFLRFGYNARTRLAFSVIGVFSLFVAALMYQIYHSRNNSLANSALGWVNSFLVLQSCVVIANNAYTLSPMEVHVFAGIMILINLWAQDTF